MKTFHSKVFFEIWNGTEKPKKNLRKESWERTSGTTKWDKLGTWDKWDKEKGVFRS